MNKQRLLVVDDEPAICVLIKDVAEGIGFEVSMTTTADAFRESIRYAAPGVIVLDLHMPVYPESFWCDVEQKNSVIEYSLVDTLDFVPRSVRREVIRREVEAPSP